MSNLAEKIIVTKNHGLEGVVYTTKDYDLFSILEGNRAINPLHVKKIIQSMMKKYLQVPIVVNDKFQIIDGQHRFTAIKQLNLPLYYFVVVGYGLKECQMLNECSKNWTIKDFIEGYAQSGNPEYIKFVNFMETYPALSHNRLYRYLLLDASIGLAAHEKDPIKSGDFKVKDYKRACENAEKIMDFVVCKKAWMHWAFMNSIFQIVRLEKYDHELMKKKLLYQSSDVERCAKQTTYYDLLSEIYNKRTPVEKQIDFKKELLLKSKKTKEIIF